MLRSSSQARNDVPSLSHRGRLALLAIAAAAGVVASTPCADSAGQAVEPPAPAPASDSRDGATSAAEAGDRTSLAFRNFVDKDFARARMGGAPVVLYFEADWCEPCKEMHARTFREPAVVEAAAGMELFRFDMTGSDGYVDIMKNSFEVIGAPTVIVFAPGGKEVARRFGFIPADEFTEMLAKGRRPPAGS